MTDTATAAKLTPARRAALLVLMGRYDRGRSGITAVATVAEEGQVNAKAAAGLIEAGLVETITGLPGCRYVRLTSTGIATVRATFGAAGWHDELVRLRAEERGGMSRTRKRATVLGALMLAAAVSMGAAGCAEQLKTPRGLGDAPIGAKDASRKDVIEMPNGFPNVASACDGHGHRVYVTSHGGKNTAPPHVVADPSCPGGAAR